MPIKPSGNRLKGVIARMNYNKKTVKDIDVKGKKVLLRCDFNVPQDPDTSREAKRS